MPSMCSKSYSHIWDFSQFSDWNCTITVQGTGEVGKTDKDMISIFNDEYPTPTPTPGSIENPGAVWISSKESSPVLDNLHSVSCFRLFGFRTLKPVCYYSVGYCHH